MADSSSPETAMRAACDAIIRGDLMTAMADLTPEAMNEGMAFASGLYGMSLPDRYEVVGTTVTDGRHRIEARFHTPSQDVTGFATWQLIDGVWKIVSLGLVT